MTAKMKSSQAPGNTPSPSNLRRKLLRWHRWIGLVSALFVILLATTGLLLNHTSSLQLDNKFLSSNSSKLFYGIQFSEPLAYEAGSQRFVQTDDGQLFLNQGLIGECQGALVGAVVLQQQMFIACERELLEVTPAAEVVERIGPAFGLPLPIDSIGSCGEQLCWKNNERILSMDVESLGWQDIVKAEAIWSKPVVLNPEDARLYLEQQDQRSISWERWFLDLHSGRLGGNIGVILVDLMALLFVVSAFSGIVIWTLGNRRKKSPR